MKTANLSTPKLRGIIMKTAQTTSIQLLYTSALILSPIQRSQIIWALEVNCFGKKTGLCDKSDGCLSDPASLSRGQEDQWTRQHRKKDRQPPCLRKLDIPPAGRNYLFLSSTASVRCSASPWNQFFFRWPLMGQSPPSAKPRHLGLTCKSAETYSWCQSSSCFQQLNCYIMPGILGRVKNKIIPKYLFEAAKIEDISIIWALFALCLHSSAMKTKTVPAPEIWQE